MTEAAEVVRMSDGDLASLPPVLARAFARDPLFVWVEPDDGRRHEFLLAYMAALARRSHRLAEAFVTRPAVRGASLWKGPDLGRLSAEQVLSSGFPKAFELLAPAARERLRALDEVEDRLEQVAPLPRFYLGVLAVDPQAQGQGLGGRLMEPILARADREGLPVSLETLRATNVDFYRRHGFEVADQGRLAGGGPAFWVMRREPRGEAGTSTA